MQEILDTRGGILPGRVDTVDCYAVRMPVSGMIEPPIVVRPRWDTVADVLTGDQPVSSLDGCSQL
jgi:hypothetical protein